MKLFEGMERTDYQDILRVIGWLMDSRGYCNVRVVEHEGGLILQVMRRVHGRPVPPYQTILLTDDEIESLLRQSYNRRRATGKLTADLAPFTPTQS